MLSIQTFFLAISVSGIFWAVNNDKQPTVDKKGPAKHVVTIYQMKFTPANLVVEKGDTVVWVNKDFVVHDVTDEKNKSWTSGPLKQGESWSKAITKDEQYYCSIHVVMKGTVKVE